MILYMSCFIGDWLIVMTQLSHNVLPHSYWEAIKNRVSLIVLKFDSTDHDCYFSIFFSYIRNVSCMAFVYWMPSLTNIKKNPCPYHDCSDLINSFVLTLQVSSVLSLNYWLWMDPTAHSKKKNGPNCFCINNISTT